MEDKIPDVPVAKATQVQQTADTTLTKGQDEAPKEQRGESLEKAIQAADTVGGARATNEAKAQEHRQAYGTAKTENLRDSGAWRIILPAFVVLCCLGLLAIPIIILSFLLKNSPGLFWIWIVMGIIEIGTAIIIGYGLLKIFTTQAGNYRR